MSTTYKAATLPGTCSNGLNLNRGRQVHLITKAAYEAAVLEFSWAPALCGAKPGRTTIGWDPDAGREVTCPRCQKAAARTKA